MPEIEYLRQIATRRALQCRDCMHSDVCRFYYNNNTGIESDLAGICKHAEQIIINIAEVKKND
jgi:hypothetical protein